MLLIKGSTKGSTKGLIKRSTKNRRIPVLCYLSCFTLMLSVAASSQEKSLDLNSELISVSVGLSKVEDNNASDYRNASILTTKDKALGLLAAPKVSRHQHIAVKNGARNKASKANKNTTNTTKSVNYHHSFSIYNAFSYLLDDDDGDGYYQTFSVVFDADLLSHSALDSAYVYAELYLSQNGGPWIYYHTTDDFIIDDNSDNDEYEVVTTLHEGFSPDSYDVLIDLYEVGFDDIVATYGSDDNNALYALPLESADVDSKYIVEVYDHYAGSMSVNWLLMSIMLFGVRFAGKPINNS